METDFKPVIGHSTNLNTLEKAFENGQTCLMECYDTRTNETVAVLCTFHQEGNEIVTTPFAILMNENPYDRLIPCSSPDYPNQTGGNQATAQ